jgi:signal transduction histidine kinase
MAAAETRLRRRVTRIDTVIAVAVAIAQVGFTALASEHQPGRYGLDALAVALLVLGSAALVIRRRYPVAVLAITFASTLTYWVIGYARGPVFGAMILALATVMMSGRRRVAWTTIVVGWLAFLWLGRLLDREPAPSLGQTIGVSAWLLVLGAVLEIVGIRRERAAEVLRARREEARRRAGDERLRIAQELHDVLAHNISLINVQASIGFHLFDEQPEQARAALAAIKQASGNALGEVRSVLDLLRGQDGVAPRLPAPTLTNDLNALVAKTMAAGLDVKVEMEGAPRPLGPAVDRAAFRIAQEALTNVARHGGGAAAIVRISYRNDAVKLQIDDAGRGAPSTSTGDGNGIVGMRERAAVLGGRLDAGPRPGGGFRVRAWLPLNGSTP